MNRKELALLARAQIEAGLGRALTGRA
jgi:hypothetical protein